MNRSRNENWHFAPDGFFSPLGYFPLLKREKCEVINMNEKILMREKQSPTGEDEERIDIELLNSFETKILDGQNIAFKHGEPIALKLGKKKKFSYLGLGLAFHDLYKRGYRAVFVLPKYHTNKKRIKQYDEYGVIEYLRKCEVLIEVVGKNDYKKDDSYILQHAYNTQSQIITNDRFENKLDKLSEYEYAKWKPWLDKNRLGFEFIGDSFIIDLEDISLKYCEDRTPEMKKSEVLE